MTDRFVDSLLLSSDPDWTQPWRLPHPVRVIGSHLVGILTVAVTVAARATSGRAQVIFSPSAGRPSDAWINVRVTVSDGDPESAGDLAKRAMAALTDVDPESKCLRGVVFDQAAPGTFTTFARLGADQPLYRRPSIGRNAMAGAIDSGSWRQATREMSEAAAEKRIRGVIAARLSRYEAAAMRTDVACLGLLDLFGLPHALSRDVEDAEDAYADAIAGENDGSVIAVDIPERVSVMLGRAVLCA